MPNTYYIDANRGRDTNSGLSKDSAWQSLEAIRAKLLTGSVGPGDKFLFEANSHFYPKRYLRIGSGVEPSTYINGNSSNPILFGKYDYNVKTNKKPKFTLNHTPKSSDWQWDATKNLWYWTYPQAYESNTLTWGHYPRVTINGKLCQVVRFESATFTRGVDPAGNLQVSVSQTTTPGRLYIWTPNASSNPSTNPTNVYGEGNIIAAGTGLAIFQFNRCGSYVNIKNLVSTESGTLASPYNDASGTADIETFIVQDCESYDSGTFVVSGMVDNGKNINNLKLINNKIVRCVGGSFQGGSKNLLIKGNYLEGMNLGRSDGGGFYLTGAHTGFGGLIEDNTIVDAKYETGGCTTDGCAIYVETGTIGITVRRNVVANSPLALQDNSGKSSNMWHSNLIINCDKIITITDQGSLATTLTKTRFYHNTGINIGMNVNYPGMPTARFAAIACRKGSSRPASNYEYDIKNNIILGSGVAATQGYGILIEPGAVFTQATNLISGFSVVKADEYSFANAITPPGTIMTNPNLLGSGRLSAGSSAIGVGTDTGLLLSDMDNSLFKVSAPNKPSIGCFEFYPLNELLYGYGSTVMN